MQNRHVIGRLTVEVSASRVTAGQVRQAEISRWIRSDSVWRSISTVFDQLVPANVVLTIPRLELTVDARSEAGFQHELRQSLYNAIERLLQAHDQLSAQVIPAGQHIDQLVWHFLETGILPWHTLPYKTEAVATFLNSFTEEGLQEDFVLVLQRKIKEKPTIWLRLIYAVGLEKARRLVLRYGHFSEATTRWLTDTANATEQRYGTAPVAQIWRIALIHHTLAQTNETAFRQTVWEQAGLAEGTADLTEKAPSRWPTSMPDEDEPVPDDGEQPETFFVTNAGLVLLSQFLPTFFTRLDLLDAGDFHNPDARHKAIHLLQYLVTGELKTYEYDLTLNKILCHLPVTGPVPRLVTITETELAEADQLLTEAIRHWSVLHNTSVAGLRETFLQRPGKLSKREMGGWQLQVERKTVDILLDRLPMGWGYSVVSLPWMPDLMYVEW